MQQMRSLTDDIQQLLLRPYREDFRGLVDSMNWEAPNGETAQNAQVLNKNIIPFLSSYISQTHDYGAVREATMLLIFHAARYQDGDMGKLEKLFDHMINDREFVRLFKRQSPGKYGSCVQSRGKRGSAATLYGRFC